jgi:tetratricopeptide (TPR) repeat protein
MATRVNKKVVIIVSACTVIGVGVVGFVALQQWRADPTRHVNAGDQAFAAGKFQEAATNYGRAIGKRRNNVEYHSKFIEASRRIVPVTQVEARERYLQLMGSLLVRAQIARDDEKLWREVLDERLLQAELADAPLNWAAIADLVSRDMEGTIAPDSPLATLAKSIRGYVDSRRIASLAPNEIDAARTLLTELVETAKGTDLDRAYGGLFAILLRDAQQFEAGGQRRQAVEAWKLFDDTLAKAKSEVPDGIQTLKWDLVRLRLRAASGDAGATDELIGGAADALAARALALDDATAVFEATKAINAPNVPKGAARASAMLTAYLAKHPEAHLHRKALAFSLQFDDPEAAERECRAILDAKPLPVSLVAATMDEIRVGAAQQLFDIEFSRFGRLTDEAARPEAIKRLEAAAERVRTESATLADNSALLRIEGKLAMAKQEWRTADAKFKEVIRKGSSIDGEIYLLSSVAAEQLGETGNAEQLINRALDFSPGNLDFLERRAELEARNGRFDAARRTIESVVARAPDRPGAKAILAELERVGRDGGPSTDDPKLRKIAEADVERLKGNVDKARAAGEEVLAQDPNYVPALIMMALIEGTTNREKALEYVRRGLAVQPDNPALQRLNVFITSDDPVARLNLAVETEFPNEPDRTVFKAVRFRFAAEEQAAEVARLTRENDPTLPQRKVIADALKAAADEWFGKAMQLDPGHPVLLDFRFSEALFRKDQAAMQAAIAEAEKSTRDSSLQHLFKARLALDQGNAGSAKSIIQRAIEQGIDSADIYRMLGLAHESTGDTADAVRAFGEAYRRKPTDMNMVKSYVAALVRSGERQTALTILRDARRVAGEDVQIGETWLDLESEIGDRALARRMRDDRYALVPNDRRNALRLATMLAEFEPERGDIAGPDGRVKYTEQQWNGLDAMQRQRELVQTRDQWRQQSDRIFASLIAAEPKNSEFAMMRAVTFRRQGRYPEAEKALRDLIQRAGAEANVPMFVALGVHFAEIDDLPKAEQAFAEAVKIQRPDARGADAQIAEYWFQKGQWARAIPHLESLRAVNNTPELALRLAETYTQARRFDEARAELDRAVKVGAKGVVVDQLEASIAEGRAERFIAEQKTAEATASLETAAAALRRAREAAPANPVIGVQEASVLRKQFELTGDRAKLDAAIAAADRSTKILGTYNPAAIAKADLLMLKGDPAAAVLELERFVRAAPSDADGRRRLVQTLVDAGRAPRAIEVVREAISLSPNDAQWRVALGEVEAGRGNLAAAIAAYEEAERLRVDLNIVQRLAELRLRRTPPNWEAVLAGLRARPDLVQGSPFLQSAVGVALHNSGETKGGLESMRSSYQFAKRLVAEGKAPPSIIDGWFQNLRLIYAGPRTADAEAFLMEVSGGKPDLHDLRGIAELWFAQGLAGGDRLIDAATRGLAIDDKKDPVITARLNDMIGTVKYLKGDCKGALAALKNAVDALPNEPAVLNNYAYLCGECADDPKIGLAAAERAVLLSRGKAEYLDTLGYVQARSGDLEKGLATLQQALGKLANASVHIHLAQVLLDLGRKQEAQSHVTAAGDLNPDPMQMKQIKALIERLR